MLSTGPLTLSAGL